MKAKKSLGQNFLTSKKAIENIVNTAHINNKSSILEIGPGKGVLTSALLATGAEVFAVEKDDRLISILNEKFEKEIKESRFHLIHQDILDFKIEDLNNIKSYKVVANIPYYITGQIIRMFLENKKQPESMTMLVQKEVAERIVSKNKKESLLSLSVKIYGTPHYISKVSKGSFTPSPKVDSAIIHIDNISRENFKNINEETFFKLIHAGFAHKRKQILPNLEKDFDKEKIKTALEKVNIPTNRSAEDIEIIDWIKLSEIL